MNGAPHRLMRFGFDRHTVQKSAVLSGAYIAKVGRVEASPGSRFVRGISILRRQSHTKTKIYYRCFSKTTATPCHTKMKD